jgi:hypothetical protein
MIRRKWVFGYCAVLCWALANGLSWRTRGGNRLYLDFTPPSWLHFSFMIPVFIYFFSYQWYLLWRWQLQWVLRCWKGHQCDSNVKADQTSATETYETKIFVQINTLTQLERNLPNTFCNKNFLLVIRTAEALATHSPLEYLLLLTIHILYCLPVINPLKPKLI